MKSSRCSNVSRLDYHIRCQLEMLMHRATVGNRLSNLAHAKTSGLCQCHSIGGRNPGRHFQRSNRVLLQNTTDLRLPMPISFGSTSRELQQVAGQKRKRCTSGASRNNNGGRTHWWTLPMRSRGSKLVFVDCDNSIRDVET